MPQKSPMHTPFQAGWYSFALPAYRPSKYTYDLYLYESLPPLPEEKFTGKLQWLTPLAKDLDENMQDYRTSSEERASMLWSPKQNCSDCHCPMFFCN
jgi:hypothetical protein